MRTAFTVTILAIFMAGTSWFVYSQKHVENLSGAWQYVDVRIIDPIDSTCAGNEIVAVYSKYNNETLKIRIDFLDLNLEQNFNLYVYIDSLPGGNLIENQPGFKWDYLIQYSNSGLMSLTTDNTVDTSNTKMRAYRDITQEFLELTFGLKNHFTNLDSTRLLLSIEAPNTNQIIDQTKAFFIKGSPPPPIDISFLFWNSIDASTPATILRSWAGAHSGPQSSRHGFSYLLRAAETWHIPVNVCGLYDSDIKFALTYLQVWPMIKTLVRDGLLNPSNYCNESEWIFLENQNTIMIPNQSLKDPLLFLSEILPNYFSTSTSKVILGGDLSNSYLGSPEILQLFFTFITSHPWINVVNLQEIKNLVTTMNETPWINEVDGSQVPNLISGAPIPSGLSTAEIQFLVMTEFSNLPQNRLSALARQVYEGILYSDQANIRLARGSYLSQLGHIIQASTWAENPIEIHSCVQDIDWDGQPECILASTNTFMTFELDGGYLAFIFIINSSGAHQIVGPSTQFGILRSDPSVILNERGIAGDPGQIIGAFADPISSLQEYHGENIKQSHIELVSEDATIRKLFTIQNNNFHMAIIDNSEGYLTARQLPLVLDPWHIYENYTPELYWSLPDEIQWIWGLASEVSVGINSRSEYESYTFNATYDALQFPEDPNYDYTLGHLLPVPMALVEFQPQTILAIDLVINP